MSAGKVTSIFVGMQTGLHIRTVVEEIHRSIVGGRIVATEYFRKLRRAFIFVRKAKSTFALGLSFHPTGYGCICLPAGKARPVTNEKPWPFFEIDGHEVADVKQFGLDRVFELVLTHENSTKSVIVEAIGPNSNLWLLDDNGTKLATLRKREIQPKESYVLRKTDLLDPLELDLTSVGDRVATTSVASPRAFAARFIQGFNTSLARELVRRAGFESGESLDDEEVASRFIAQARELVGRFDDPSSGYLYEIDGAAVAFPFKLASVDAQPDKFKGYSLAVLASMEKKQGQREQVDTEKETYKAVERAIKRQSKLIDNLERDLQDAQDYEKYKRMAELLQINRDRLVRGLGEIEVEDILTGDGAMVTVKLDATLTPNDNIEQYFKRHRKGRDALDVLSRRLEIATSERDALSKMLEELRSNFDQANMKYEAELVGLFPRTSERGATAPRLPYREAALSTGVRIFIGRDGSDNDRTTFDFAKPYELWFHTQQCPGSHVVMKFPHKSFQPSKREIEETAAIAAFHSKARKDSLVPVIYAERRYVRKPRKAKPGLVTVEREKSVMVQPAPQSDS